MPYKLILLCFLILLLLILLFYHVFFFFFSLFLIIDLYCLITAVIAQIFNPIAKLVTPTAIPSKEAKGEIDIHPVTAEATIRKCSI